jgi:hypothetical protein
VAASSVAVASSVVVASAGGGAATLAALDVVTCGVTYASLNDVVTGDSPLSYLISPVRRAGLAAAVAGNVGIMLCGAGLNALLAVVVNRYVTGSKADDVSEDVAPKAASRAWKAVLWAWPLHGHAASRFPALAVRLADLLLPGTAMLAFGSLAMGPSAPWYLLLVSAVGAVAVAGGVWVMQRLTRTALGVMLLVETVVDRGNGQSDAFVLERLLSWVWRGLQPRGEWQPEAAVIASGPLVTIAGGAEVARWLHTYTLCVSVVSSAGIGVAASVESAAACGALLGVLGVGLLGGALFVGIVKRPYRMPHEGVLIPLQGVVLSVMCFLKAAQQIAPAWLKLLQSLLMALQAVITVALMVARRLVSRGQEEEEAAEAESQIQMMDDPSMYPLMEVLEIPDDDARQLVVRSTKAEEPLDAPPRIDSDEFEPVPLLLLLNACGELETTPSSSTLASDAHGWQRGLPPPPPSMLLEDFGGLL